MGPESLFIVGLAITAVVLLSRALAARIGVPDAILLVVLGAAVAFLPGMPEIALPPEVVLLGFLPPLVYYAAFFSSPREAKADAVPITALAIGLTTVTTLAVAAVLRWILPDLSWAAAIALGAAVAPTDPVAAISIMKRLNAPGRLVTIVEGENLINDAVALTAFVLAVEALTTPFTLGHGIARLAEVVAGGVAYGLAVGFVASRLRRRIRDPGSQIVVTLLTPYLAFVPAEELGFSGVLAAVCAGFYLGTRGEGMLQPASRLPGQLFWQVLVFLLESALFVLLGLEVRLIVRQLTGAAWSSAILGAVAVTAVIVALRLAWTQFVFPLSRYLPGRHFAFDHLPWRDRLVIGWSGMRGAISLAIVLSLPVSAPGLPPERRGERLFVIGAVVFIALIGCATTLPGLLRRLGLAGSDRVRIEYQEARKAVVDAALARLDELIENGEVDDRTGGTFRRLYESLLDQVRTESGEDLDEEVTDVLGLRRELVRTQREKLRRLYSQGSISAEVMRAVDRWLDLEDPDIREIG
ncbi:Na+/H+ antiporter [Actinomadura livida]|uniref:CPA1 family monovalent cation:H+ antiporter n=1 Tax=Actinomadura livida TaxID=79909 RepID=A0A7W7IB81_9ACTN|nr:MULTISPECIES: Na+/H+ antiporter [Actinomadura]MBB4773790.1 CPA1 family monovalent cation:H+ antiporter [Actinomadura catellatispora]GGU10738.1 Na+/H+ antiporter [Actinomadura livida]